MSPWICEHPNKPNHHFFWQATPTPPWSSVFVLSFTKVITLSFPVSFPSSLCWTWESSEKLNSCEHWRQTNMTSESTKFCCSFMSFVSSASTASEHCTAETPAAVPNLNELARWVGIIVGSTPSEWKINLFGGWACDRKRNPTSKSISTWSSWGYTYQTQPPTI